MVHSDCTVLERFKRLVHSKCTVLERCTRGSFRLYCSREVYERFIQTVLF